MLRPAIGAILWNPVLMQVQLVLRVDNTVFVSVHHLGGSRGERGQQEGSRREARWEQERIRRRVGGEKENRIKTSS